MAAITAGILCQFAQVRDNMLFIYSGGVTRLTTATVPTQTQLMLALTVEVRADEHARAHELTVAVKQPDTATEIGRLTSGVKVAPAGVAFPGESLLLPAVVDMRGGVLPTYGAYDVLASVDDEPGPLLTFYVVKPPGTT